MEEQIVYHVIGKDPLYKTWHASNEHLLMYIHSDGGSIVSEEKVFPIKKGVLVFIAASTYHYTMPDDPAIYERSKLTVSRQNFTKISETFKDNSIFKNILDKAIVYAEIDECERCAVDEIFTEINNCKNDDKEIILSARLLQLLFFLNKYMVQSTSAVTGFMSKAIKYINEHISSDINIDNICSAINISKYHFCREFKKHTGITVMQYILKTRIVLAKGELKKTNLSISEISEKCGFSGVSYFCHVFKREESCSPMGYRRRRQTE